VEEAEVNKNVGMGEAGEKEGGQQASDTDPTENTAHAYLQDKFPQTQPKNATPLPAASSTPSTSDPSTSAPSTPTRASELLTNALNKIAPPTPVTPVDLITATLMNGLFDDDDLGLDDESSVGGDSLYDDGDFDDGEFDDDDVQFEKRFRTASLAEILANKRTK
jgi:hypothetical protein